MTSIALDIAANQRLIVLRALAAMNDGRLNETMIRQELDLFGYRLTQDEVRDILRWLSERSAVITTFAADVIMIAEITRRGEDHLERRGDPIDGIALPSRR